METVETMDQIEMLARMWIECDPNRGGAPGSGYHPDDIEPTRLASTLASTGELVENPNPSAGKKRWEWFVPRAEASAAYFKAHGYALVKVQ